MDKPEPTTPVSRLRKVTFNETARSDGPQQADGYFHAWGLFQQGVNGPWHTVAIVEISDGTLHYVFPEEMRFLDDPQHVKCVLS